jgi:HSP20 family protein
MANLQRWDPFSELTTMHSQLDDIFDNFFGGNRLAGATNAAPAMDVYTDGDKQLVAEVQAPGFDKDDVEVSVHDGVLEIKGEKHDKQEEGKEDKRNYMLRESHASFYRRIALPRHADADNVKAHFDNGMLRVSVPFKELPQPKRVAIEGGQKSAKKKTK